MIIRLIMILMVTLLLMMPGGVWAMQVSALPHVTTGMLFPSFWSQKTNDADRVIMNTEQISAFNHEIIQALPDVVYDLSQYPIQLTKDQLNKFLTVNSFPEQPMYRQGKAVSGDYYEQLKYQMNMTALIDSNPVQYAFTVKRTNLRTYPTNDAIFESPDDDEFDMFQETAVEPAQPVLILHKSADAQWYYVQIHNYRAWMRASDVAVTSDRQAWLAYQQSAKFLVVTGNQLRLGYNPYSPELSGLTFQMGTKLALVDDTSVPTSVDNQSSAGNYVVKLPVRDSNGQLQFKLALVSVANDVSTGYLPYTRANVIKQAFKIQGQRYDWGGSFEGRDCSAFVSDVYRSFGFQLPRNTGEQARSAGKTVKFDGTVNERVKILNGLPPGTLLYIPGHVMLYLGEHRGHYYVIHDTPNYGDPSQKKADGTLNGILINQVTVTDLSLYDTSGKTLLELLTVGKQIRSR